MYYGSEDLDAKMETKIYDMMSGMYLHPNLYDDDDPQNLKRGGTCHGKSLLKCRQQAIKEILLRSTPEHPIYGTAAGGIGGLYYSPEEKAILNAKLTETLVRISQGDNSEIMPTPFNKDFKEKLFDFVHGSKGLHKGKAQAPKGGATKLEQIYVPRDSDGNPTNVEWYKNWKIWLGAGVGVGALFFVWRKL